MGKKKDNNKDRLKAIRGDFLGFLLLGVIVFCIGIGFINSTTEGSWVPQNPFTAQEEKEEKMKIGAGCMIGGVVLALFGGFYYDHAKANYKRDLAMMETIKEAGKNENEADKLKQLKEMYDSKLITEDEFEKKKKEILDKM